MTDGGRRLGHSPGWEKTLENVLTADFNEYMKKWIPLSIVIGIVGGIFSVIFQYLIAFIWNLSYGTATPWYIVFLIPALGGLIVGIILSYFPTGQGFGADEVIKSIHQKGGRIKWYLVPVAIISSAITIGSGGSAGREGPSAMIGAGLASTIGTKLGLKRADMRIFLIAGTAACFSALFRAPLGCAVYALEIPYKSDIESNAAIPSLLSSVVAYLVSISFFGVNPYLQMNNLIFTFDYYALGFIVIVGLVTGIVGIVFILFFRAFQRIMAKIAIPFALKVALGGLMVGIIGLSVPEALGLGEHTINGLLNGGTNAFWVIVALLVAKMAATVLTIGSGGSGGIFFPSLFMGGTVGAIIANLFQLSNPGLYVLVGMGAMMAGVTKTPLSTPIMITEIVAGYGVLIPVMIASTLAYVVTGNFSLYRNQITRKTFSFDISTLGSVRVNEIIDGHVVTLNEKSSAADAMEIVHKHQYHIYPVLNEKERLVGWVYRHEVEKLLSTDQEFTLEDIIQTEIDRIPSDLEVLDVFEMMNKNRQSKNIRMIVVEPWDREVLVGILTRMDILRALENLDEHHN